MPSAATLRVQIESALAHKIPAALTPAARTVYPVTPTGIPHVDALLNGGIPIGAITEIAGPDCSGRTSLALSTLARITAEGKVAAWVDVSDALHPESAAAAGIHLPHLLWIRCGTTPARTLLPGDNHFTLTSGYFTAPTPKKGLHGGGFGPHPRSEEKGLSAAVSGLLAAGGPAVIHPRTAADPQHSKPHLHPAPASVNLPPTSNARGPIARIAQALRVIDLLLQAGGFCAIVVDLAGIAPEHVTRIPAATWFRYRAAAEKTRAAILLLTQHTCAQSSAALVLRMQAADFTPQEPTVFTGLQNTLEVARHRFAPPFTNLAPLRKPPQSAHGHADNGRHADWHTCPTWIPKAATT